MREAKRVEREAKRVEREVKSVEREAKRVEREAKRVEREAFSLHDWVYLNRRLKKNSQENSIPHFAKNKPLILFCRMAVEAFLRS